MGYRPAPGGRARARRAGHAGARAGRAGGRDGPRAAGSGDRLPGRGPRADSRGPDQPPGRAGSPDPDSPRPGPAPGLDPAPGRGDGRGPGAGRHRWDGTGHRHAVRGDPGHGHVPDRFTNPSSSQAEGHPDRGGPRLRISILSAWQRRTPAGRRGMTSPRCPIRTLSAGAPAAAPAASRYQEGGRYQIGGPMGPLFWCCPAASYSPTPSRVQYHRRWRA